MDVTIDANQENANKSQWGSEPRIEVIVKMQNKVRGVPRVQLGVRSGGRIEGVEWVDVNQELKLL